jgi:hypothetical protein
MGHVVAQAFYFFEVVTSDFIRHLSLKMLAEQLGRCMSARITLTSLGRISRAYTAPRARWQSTTTNAAPDGPAISETNRTFAWSGTR